MSNIVQGIMAKDNRTTGAGFIYRREWINLSNNCPCSLVQLRIAKVNPFPPIDETSTSAGLGYSAMALIANRYTSGPSIPVLSY